VEVERSDQCQGILGGRLLLCPRDQEIVRCSRGRDFRRHGGTPIPNLDELESIRQDPALTNVVAAWDKALQDYAKVKADPKLESNYLADLDKWTKEVKAGLSTPP